MKERIKELRKRLGLTQQEFADKLGIKRGSIGNYELGRNIPVDSVIALICDRCHVNETWLRTGEGDMFVEVSRDDELQRLIDASMNDEAGEIKRRIAAAVMRLSPEQLRICTDWIKDTFNLVDAAAAGSETETDQKEREITKKLASYEAELRAEMASGKSEASRVGSASNSKEKTVSAG